MLEAVRAEAQEARHTGVAGGGARRKKGKKKGKGKGKGKKGGKRRGKGKGNKGGDGASKPPGAVESKEQEDAAGKQEEDEDKPAAAVEDFAICLLELPPRDPYGNDSSEDEEDGEDGEAVATLACSHSFHAGCLGMWKARCGEKGLVATCPMCRGPIG